MPNKVSKVKQAIGEFKQYMVESEFSVTFSCCFILSLDPEIQDFLKIKRKALLSEIHPPFHADLFRIVVENERQSIQRGESTADNLLSILVRSADQNKLSNGQKTLSDDEIYGNLFIYNVAGHDTASGTLAHCLVLLAANPIWQDWVSEEINHVFQGKDPKEEDYVLAFPRLKRCLALMVRL